MTEREPYLTAGGVEHAIRDAAKRAAGADPSLDVNKRIQLEHFNRFLSRIFSEGDSSEWVLKGGTGILARVSSTRATRDIDLFRQGFTLAESLSDLIRLAKTNLADHFRFEYVSRADTIGTDAQPYTEGCRVKFAIFIGVSPKGSLQVDLAVSAGVTGAVKTTEPMTALDLPRLISHPYRLYPVADQIADKVCATMAEYGERASSREKDLVDLVVLAATHDVDGTALCAAIAAESRRRKMPPFEHFVVPSSWGDGYSRLSKPVPHCNAHSNVELASALVARLIDPALCGDADGRTWSHAAAQWV